MDIKGWLIIFGLLAAAVLPVRGDIIHLKDGSKVQGDIRRTDDGWAVTDKAGHQVMVTADKVASIEATGRAGADVAEQRLISLRRATDNLTDIKQIIERYNAFITQYPGTPTTEKAKSDLAIWKERLAKNLVHVGDAWVTRQEQGQLVRESHGIAIQAMRLIAESRFHDADPLLDRALAINSTNAAAWYLKGIVLYRQDQIVPARKAFESSLAIDPDCASTLNNLAVIYWRQNAQPAALAAYDKALLAAPGDQHILDNLAEALYALPEEQRKSALTKKIVRHFNEQDLAAQARLKARGLYRWGGTWVSAAELDKLQKAEKDIQGKIAVMSVKYDNLTAQIVRIDSDIKLNEDLAHRMELDSNGIDAMGRPVRYPLPPSYYDIIQTIGKLKGDRALHVAEQASLRRSARQLQQQIVGPKYTGVQKLIDVEGTPLPRTEVLAALNSPRPSITPSTAPSPTVAGIQTTAPPSAVLPAAPPVTRPATALPATAPPRTYIPPEKPSILDRRFDDPPPPGLLDGGHPPER